jgi:tetratricopeptide (TPR) repeat protein
LLGVALVAACVAALWGVWGHEFVLLDDDANIYENPLVVPGSERSLARIWLEPYRTTYMPLIYSSWYLLADLASVGSSGQLDPGVFHLTNVVLHGLNVLLVFALLRRLVRTEVPAACGAAFFGLHPLQVEAVAWASGMKDLLFAFFALLALSGYVAAAGGGRRTKLLRYGLATAALVAALLAKPMAVVVPVLALVLDVVWLQRRWSTVARWLAPWVLLALARAVGTVLMHPDGTGVEPVSWWLRPLVAGDTLTFYLAKIALPIGLCIDYGRTPESVLAHWTGYVAWVVPVSLAAVAWWQWRKRRWIAASLAFFAVGVAPVSGLVSFLFQGYSTVADRYVYLSMVGLAVLVAGALRSAGALRYGVALLALVGLAATTSAASRHWRDSHALFSRALAVNANSALAHGNLGAAALAEGRQDEALEHLRAAIRLRSEYPVARKNLAMIWMQRGELDKAQRQLRAALDTLPGYWELHFQWGRLHEMRGDLGTAGEAYRQVLELSPGHADAHVNLGVLLGRAGDLDGARRHFLAALDSNPRSAEAHANLGAITLQRGDARGAIPHLEEALRLRPDLTQIQALLQQARGRQ